MFIEPIQYSINALSVVIKNYTDEQKVLPVSMSTNNVKCLDFDMDTIVFKSASSSPINCSQIAHHDKTWLDVMEMV